MGQTLIAIVAEGNRSRAYVAPGSARNAGSVCKAQMETGNQLPNDPRNFWTVDYGLTTFGDLFTDRQLVALNTFSDLCMRRVSRSRPMLAAGFRPISPRCATAARCKGYAEALSVYLAFALNRSADRGSTICWDLAQMEALEYLRANQFR
jgi:putative DNA methylase